MIGSSRYNYLYRYVDHVHVYNYAYVLYKPHTLPRLDLGFAVGRGLELGDSIYPTDENDSIAEFIPLRIHTCMV